MPVGENLSLSCLSSGQNFCVFLCFQNCSCPQRQLQRCDHTVVLFTRPPVCLMEALALSLYQMILLSSISAFNYEVVVLHAACCLEYVQVPTLYPTHHGSLVLSYRASTGTKEKYQHQVQTGRKTCCEHVATSDNVFAQEQYKNYILLIKSCYLQELHFLTFSICCLFLSVSTQFLLPISYSFGNTQHIKTSDLVQDRVM